MKTFARYELLNQKKSLSHFAIAGFSLVVVLIMRLSGKLDESFSSLLSAFVLLVAQLEVFIFFGTILFSRVKFDKSPGEITRTVLFRLIIFLASCLLASLLLFIIMEYAVTYAIRGDVSKVFYYFFHDELSSWIKSTLTGLSAGALIFIIFQWQDSLHREQRLREENLIFQNETLKSQVNPHFLFNSLNTVSSLIQSDPEKAEQFINNLSSVYRYVLENGQKDMVPLKEELDLINRYFDLHRVRDEEKIRLSVEWTGSSGYQIIPISLQILLENAIKHNMATRETPLIISVYIEDQFVVVRNNIRKKAVQIQSTGTGLKNLRERIRLATGKELVTEETNEFYTVKIPLLK
jgi:LytS/YehU family sensor histidine kinase